MFNHDILVEILKTNREILKTLNEIKDKEYTKNIDFNIENLGVSTGSAEAGGVNIIAFDDKMAKQIHDNVTENKIKEDKALFGNRNG